MQYKISLIIPCYNTAAYLNACLDSVFGDEFSKFIQVIAINDGSTDNTAQILNHYATNFKNLIVITQENKGLCAAKNAGLEVANGEYIAFLDSDDLLENGGLNALYKASAGADIVIGNYFELRGTKKTAIKSYDLKEVKIQTKKDLDEFYKLFCVKFCNFSVSAKLYKREFLANNNLKFLESIFMGEDAHFNARAFALAQSLIQCDAFVYAYRIGQNNNSKKANLKHFYDLCEASKSLSEFSTQTLMRNSKKAFYLGALCLRLKYEWIASLNFYKLGSKHEYAKLLREGGKLNASIKRDIKSAEFKFLLLRVRVKIWLYYIFGDKIYILINKAYYKLRALKN